MGQGRVTNDSLGGSAHEQFSCVDCHGGMPDRPVMHTLPAPKVSCLRCHGPQPQRGAKPASAVRHGKAGVPADILPACADCHGSHQILPSSDAGSTVSRQRVSETCAQCHGTGGRAADRTGDTQVKEYRSSVHGRPDPERPGLYGAVCTDCHGKHIILPAADDSSTVSRMRVPATCGACHTDALADYRSSTHGRALASGVTDAPSCTDCHGEHNILGPGDAQSSVSQSKVVETCSRCHADMTLIRRYNLPVGSVDSYGKSYHGVANRFGQIEVASCVSCHSYHRILPSSDVRSTVHPANLPATCGAPDCHPGAGVNFAKGSIHLNPTPRSDKPVFWVAMIYLVFIWVLISSFILMIFADLVQHGRRGWKVHEPDPSRPLDHVHVQRFTRSQLLQHATLITSFLLLLITGFPVRFAESAASAWVIQALGGMTVRANLHRFAAVLLIGVCIWHVLWTVFTPRGRADFLRMLPKPRDIGRAIGMLKYYLGFAMEMPGFGRFNLIEKFEYLAMGWGSLVMIVTGFALWFPELALRYIPKWGLDVCHVVHGYEAVLAFLAIIIWHFYHVHWKPGLFPMSRVWLDGKMSLAEMRHEHRLEYERLTQELTERHREGGLAEASESEVLEVAERIETGTAPASDEPLAQSEPADPEGPAPDGEAPADGSGEGQEQR